MGDKLAMSSLKEAKSMSFNFLKDTVLLDGDGREKLFAVWHLLTCLALYILMFLQGH